MNGNLLDHRALHWTHYSDDSTADMPISYWGTILDIDTSGHISVLYRWDPHCYCHFHRHLCSTTSIVLSGELHVSTYEGHELTAKTVRTTGDYAKKPPGDIHMEQGGADGALVLFELYAPDGQLTDQLDQEGNILRTLTTDHLRHASATGRRRWAIKAGRRAH